MQQQRNRRAGSVLLDKFRQELDEILSRIRFQTTQLEGNITINQMPPGTVGPPPDGDPSTGLGLYAYPKGPASGDLRGNYPGPRVKGLQTRPVADLQPAEQDALLFIGGVWRPGKIAVDVTPTIHNYPSLAASSKVLSLWNSTTHLNASAPANWQTSGFDATAWNAGVVVDLSLVNLAPYAGSQAVTYRTGMPTTQSQAGEDWLLRQQFTLPDVSFTTATLTITADDQLRELYINGAAVITAPPTERGTFTFDIGALLVAGTNTLAVRVRDTGQFWTFVDWLVTTVYNPAASGRGHVIYDETTVLPQRTNLRFLGAVVTASDNVGADATDVTIIATGSQWRNGTGAPSNTLGIDGDYYLDDGTGFVYAKAAGAYTHVATIMGPAGTAGSVWRNGSGVPSNSLGVDGDYYLNTANGDVYLRASSIYSIVANITGPAGPAGPTGPSGSSGVTTATAPLRYNSGTQTIDFQDQNANMVLAGPTTGSAAAPSFRALIASDIPAIAESGVTNLTTDLAAKAPIANPTFTGIATAPIWATSGLTGATAASRYVGATTGGAPATGTFAVGDYVIDQTGKIYVCTVAGTPGTWASAAGTWTDPTTTLGDLIVRGSTGVARFPIGLNGQTIVADSVQTLGMKWATAGVIDPSTTFYDYDDFIGNNVGNNTAGKWNWNFVNGTLITQTVPDANHIGVVRRATAATLNQLAYMWTGNGNAQDFILPASNFDITWILALATNDANTMLRFGLGFSNANDPPNNGIWFEKVLADTSFFGVCRASSAQTRTSALLATDTSYHRFRLRRVNSTTIGFSVDGGTEATITANIPTVALAVLIQIATGAAAAKSVDLDYVGLTVSVTR